MKVRFETMKQGSKSKDGDSCEIYSRRGTQEESSLARGTLPYIHVYNMPTKRSHIIMVLIHDYYVILFSSWIICIYVMWQTKLFISISIEIYCKFNIYIYKFLLNYKISSFFKFYKTLVILNLLKIIHHQNTYIFTYK